MNRMNHLEQVDYIAQLADLKQALYHNSLLINALIELLVEKEMMTAQDIATMSTHLDASYTPQPMESLGSHSTDASMLQQATDPARLSQSVDDSFTHQLMNHIRAPHPAAAHSIIHPPADPTL